MFRRKDNLNKNELPIPKQQASVEELFGDIPKDSDVIEEENRISLMNKTINDNNNSEIFIVDKLTKHYSDFMAVKGISFAIGGSECFGLLGVNGAGKTSTFKMITGDEFITKGEAYLNQIKCGLVAHNRSLCVWPTMCLLASRGTNQAPCLMPGTPTPQ